MLHDKTSCRGDNAIFQKLIGQLVGMNMTVQAGAAGALAGGTAAFAEYRSDTKESISKTYRISHVQRGIVECCQGCADIDLALSSADVILHTRALFHRPKDTLSPDRDSTAQDRQEQGQQRPQCSHRSPLKTTDRGRQPWQSTGAAYIILDTIHCYCFIFLRTSWCATPTLGKSR